MTVKDALLSLYILAIPAIVACFLRDKIFRSWVRFILVWAPLSFILIVLSGPYSDIIGPGSGGVSKILAGITVMVSFLIFFLKSWELYRIDKGNPLAWWIKWPSLVTAFVLSGVLSVYIYGLFW